MINIRIITIRIRYDCLIITNVKFNGFCGQHHYIKKNFQNVSTKRFHTHLIQKAIFYPRQVLPFGYCHRPRLWACVSVCVCVSITCLSARETSHPFKLGYQIWMCKTPWLRSLLFWPPRSNLISKSKFIPFWTCPHPNSSSVDARITKFGP